MVREMMLISLLAPLLLVVVSSQVACAQSRSMPPLKMMLEPDVSTHVTWSAPEYPDSSTVKLNKICDDSLADAGIRLYHDLSVELADFHIVKNETI